MPLLLIPFEALAAAVAAEAESLAQGKQPSRRPLQHQFGLNPRPFGRGRFAIFRQMSVLVNICEYLINICQYLVIFANIRYCVQTYLLYGTCGTAYYIAHCLLLLLLYTGGPKRGLGGRRARRWAWETRVRGLGSVAPLAEGVGWAGKSRRTGNRATHKETADGCWWGRPQRGLERGGGDASRGSWEGRGGSAHRGACGSGCEERCLMK